MSRAVSGRVRKRPISHGSGRVASDRTGSSQELLKSRGSGRVGSGRVGSGEIRPADRKKPCVVPVGSSRDNIQQYLFGIVYKN